jgi:TolB-like protein/DNA-binding SARP family transcriptional activator
VGTGVEIGDEPAGPARPSSPLVETSPIALRLLGPLRVERDGAEVALPASRKVRALLAYLVMAPRPIHRSTLCEMFWDVPDDPRGELRWCLSKIRGALGPGAIAQGKEGRDWVSVDSSTLRVDALELAALAETELSGGSLDRLNQMAAKFGGEFLERFEADRIPLFETWLIGERQKFLAMHLAILSRIAALIPNTEETIPLLRKRLALTPYDEAAHRNLIAALTACGRFAEAKVHLEATARLFKSQGLGSAVLDKSLREVRRLVEQTRLESEVSSVTEIRPSGFGGEAPEAPRLSLVVLPFMNLSGDPGQDYFADGVTESLTTDLSRIRGAIVIARNTAFTYKGKPLDVRMIGRELDVRYVLEGSVQRDANRMRVNAQLIDAETGNHLWAERFDKPLADLFDMQDEIAARLAGALNEQLAVAEARRARHAPTPHSMDLYFQGMAWFYRGLAPKNLAEARSFFDRALSADSDNVDALVGLAAVEAIEGSFLFVPDPAAAFVAAEGKLIKALSSVPDHARGHMYLGYVGMCTKRAVQGVAECEHALALDRNLATAHAFIGLGKIFIGRAEETEAHIGEALRLSPRDTTAYTWMNMAGLAKLHLGEYAQAIAWLRRAIEANRNNPHPYFLLSAALAQLSRVDEARSAIEAGLALNPAFTVSRTRALWTATSDDPTHRTRLEPILEGLRKAGAPE